MTKEQFRDDILMTMQKYIDEDVMMVLKGVLVDRLNKVEFAEMQYPETIDNNNEYLIRMFNTFKGQRLSERSMRAYNYTLKKFLEVIGKPFVNVTSNDIEYFMIRQKCSEVTKNNYRRNLSAFFAWMVKKRIITFNPCNEVESYKEIKKPIDHLEATEMEQVKEGCKTSKERALIEVLRCTGVRVGELISIKISDIDFNTGKIIVYGQKSKKYRVVMLDKVALGYVKRYLNDIKAAYDSDKPLFISRRSRAALTECGIRCMLKRIAERGMNGRRIYPHLFRKSVATTIIRHGGTIGDAGDYLGHTENTVTGRHYTFKDDSHIENIFNRYVAIV